MVASTTRARVRECLNGVDFPANKQRLMHAAARNSCDDDTAHALRAIPPETYANLGEVLSSVRLTDETDLSDGANARAPRVHGNARLVEERRENRVS